MLPNVEQFKLFRAKGARNFSESTNEIITQILLSTRTNQGYGAAEEKAKEIRLLIESDISEEELVKKLKEA